MKKTIKNLLYTLCAFYLLMGSASAATLVIGNDSTTAGASGKSVSVEIKDDDLKDYVEVQFGLSISGTNYASHSFSPKLTSNNITFNGDTGTYSFKASGGLYATTIGSISYTTTSNLNSNFTIVPTNVKFIKEDGTTDSGKISGGTITYEKAKSTDASLTALTVSQGTLSPAFSSDVTEYTVNISDKINTITITATPAAGATKTGTGNKTLNMGANEFEVEVTAEDGTTKKTYKITVNRGEVETPSAYLKSLSINNIGCVLSPEFDSKNTKYTVDATSDITELDLKYELEDSAATVSIDGNEDFKLGKNVIKINVKSSDGKETQTYEITVNVTDIESSEESTIDEEDGKKGGHTWLIILIILIAIAIIVGVAYVLFKKKKGSGGKKTPKDGKNAKEEKPVEEVSEEPEEDGNYTNEDSVTEILKGELFDDDATTTYNSSDFASDSDIYSEEDDLEKTKEFNFKDNNF